MQIHLNKLEDIEEWGKLLLTQGETALALGISLVEFQADEDMVRAYKKGRLITVSTHKKKIIALANQGSGPAQSHLEKLRKEEDIDSIRNAWG